MHLLRGSKPAGILWVLSGYAADRFGAKLVLVSFALVGAASSLVVGWLNELNVALLLALVGIYGFAIIGDSSVLSSAMTDAVPASQLARALGLRSILGIGAGSVSPIAFGMALDMTPAIVSWGLAFCTLPSAERWLSPAILLISVGTAVAGALLVGLLSAAVMRGIADNPMLPSAVQSQVDLDNITFVSNDRLKNVLEGTTATPPQLAEAVRINTEARLRALKIGLLIMAGLALLSIIPAGRLPNYVPGEIPQDQPLDR